MKHLITEEHVEENVLDILKNLDYDIIRGSNEEYLPGGSSALRSDYKEVVLVDKSQYALRKIELELTEMIRNSVTIDWTQRESVQAGMRLKVKKILRKYGYPPDKEKNAIETVLKQAELIAKGWVGK